MTEFVSYKVIIFFINQKRWQMDEWINVGDEKTDERPENRISMAFALPINPLISQ